MQRPLDEQPAFFHCIRRRLCSMIRPPRRNPEGPMTPSPPLSGLSAAEVAERVARGQLNRVRRSDARDYLAIVRRNVVTLFNALIVPAAIALFLIDDFKAGVTVSGMALTNLLIGL